MLDNLKNYTIIGLLIALPFLTIGSYIKGRAAGENEIKQYYEKAEQANTIYWQTVVNKLSESANQARINNELRFKGLNDEFVQASNHLRLCQYNNNQLRLIKTAANLQVATSARMGAPARTGITPANESGEQFSCQDAGATMIKWAEQYFSCKAKLDYLQGMWKHSGLF